MARNLVPRIPLLLALSRLTDDDLHTLAGDVKSASSTSKLVANNPAMAASGTALVTKAATLTTASKAVADDRAKLHTDLAEEAVARTAVIAEARTYATFASNDAKIPADVHGAGLVARDKSVPKLPPAVPGSINTKTPVRGHGKIVVSVHETGPTRRQYIAEQSSDGINYGPLGVGRGKTRTLTGASGTKVWVRFATVRGSLVSDWCTAVLVTIP